MGTPKKVLKVRKVSVNAIGSAGGVRNKNSYEGDLPYNTKPSYFITPWEEVAARQAYNEDILKRKKLMEQTGDSNLPPVGPVGYDPSMKNYVGIRRVATNLTPEQIRTTPLDSLLNTVAGYKDKRPITLKEFTTYPQNIQEEYGIPGELEFIKKNSYSSGGGLSRVKDYGSAKKPYPMVKSSDFAGGGRSYPIPTAADAKDALFLAKIHHRPDVIAKVHARYPNLQTGGPVMQLAPMIEAPIGTLPDTSTLMPMSDSNIASGSGFSVGGLTGAADMVSNTLTTLNPDKTGQWKYDVKEGTHTLSGAAKGAATGAAIGSIIPGIGTAIGAGIGTVFGGVSGFFGAKGKEKQLQEQIDKRYTDMVRNDRLSTLEPSKNYLPVARYGGLLTYKGATHDSPSGGISVDKLGNPTFISQGEPMAMTENNEVVWKKPNNNAFVFSKELGYADQAQKIIKKYGLDKRLIGTDKWLETAIDKQLSDLAETQELEKASKGEESDLTYARGGSLTANKAKLILKHGKVRGHRLTKKQKRFFGMIAGGKRSTLAKGGNLSPIGEVLSGAGDVANYLAYRNQKPYVETPYTISPETINLAPERAAMEENANLAENINAMNARNLGLNAGQAFNAMTTGNTGVERTLGQQLGQSYEKQATTNAGLATQTNLANQRAVNATNYYNALMENSYRNKLAALNPLGSLSRTAAQYFANNASYNRDLMIALLSAPNATMTRDNQGFFPWLFGQPNENITWSGPKIESVP